MAQYDGSIRIDTRVDTKGLQRGLTSVKGDLGKFKDSIHNGMSALDRGITDIGGKIKQMGSGMRREVSSVRGSVDGLSGSFKKLGATIASVFAVRKIAGIANSFTGLGSDLEEVQNVVDVTFSTMSDKIDEFAKAADKSAGLSETMAKRYVGTFGAMSKSFGFAEKDAYSMSTALTQLAGDVASFYNITQDEAYTKLKSVFTGETETLKDLGVVMTENALNSYAMAKGIGKTVSKMTEQQKVALRYQFVLEKLSGASGDFVRTQDSWANQTRILRLQIDSLKATIGQGLINVLTPLLKMLNTLLEKLKQVANAFKSFTESFFGKSQTGGTGSGSKCVDTAEGITGSLEDVSGAAKDAEKSLEGYLSPLDEINKYSAGKDDDLLSDLEDIDFGNLSDLNMEVNVTPNIDDSGLSDKFAQMAEKVKNVLNSLFNPLKEAWDREGEFVMDSWKYALNNVWELIKSIGADFLEVWQQEKTISIFENILHIIGDIGLVAGNLAAKFREAWNENNTGLHILENIRDIIGVIVANIRHAADVTVEWSKNLDFSPLLTKVMEWTASLVPVFDSLSGILTDFYEKVLLPLGQWVLEKGLPDLLQVFIDFNNLVDWENLRSNFDTLWEHLEPFAETIGEGLIIFIERVSDALANFLNSQDFKDFLVTVENWMDSVKPEDVADALELVAKGLIALKLALLGYSAIKGITGIFGTIKSFLAIFGVGGSAAKTAANMDTVAASIGGLSTALTALAGVAAVAGSYKLLTGHLEELFAAFGKSTDQGRRLEERYEGLDGAARFAKDGIDTLKNGIEGYGFAADNCVGTGVALEKAMEDIQNGAILTDEHMEELQNRFSLTDDDMEMLRQEMLDCNPILREIADNLGFEDASPETLQDIAEGFGKIANGVEPLPDDLANMTEEARGFLERVMESETPMVVFGEKLENIGAISDNTSESLNETGKSISDGLMKGMEEADVEAGSENLFSRLIGKIKELFGIHSPSTVMAEIGGFIVEGMLNGILDSLKSIGSWIKEHIFQPFIDGFKNAFDIHSPSGVMENMGEYIIEGLLNGLKNMWGSITSWIEDKVGWIIDKFQSVKDKVSGFFSGGGSGDSGQSYSSRTYSMRSLSAPYVHPAIAKLSNIEIPKLATGAVLPANREFLALVGDQKHGTNVEAPLDMIRQANREAVLGVLSELGITGNLGNGNPQTLIVKLVADGRELTDLVIRNGEVRQMSTGNNPFLLGTT